MPKRYRLISGKIARPDADGTNQIHRAPYDFVPTELEYKLNKHRLLPLKDEGAPATGTDTVAAAVQTAKTEPADSTPEVTLFEGIHKMSFRQAVAYLQTVTDPAELDKLFLQESGRNPNRKSVFDAIETRRAVITFGANE